MVAIFYYAVTFFENAGIETNNAKVKSKEEKNKSLKECLIKYQYL